MEIAYSRDGISNQDILSATLNGEDARFTPPHHTTHARNQPLKTRTSVFIVPFRCK